MRETVIGGNGFRDCPILLAFGGKPLLSVSTQSGQIHLEVPDRTQGVALSIDGPVMHRDEKEPNLIHLYLLSYERHALVAHFKIAIPSKP